MTDADAGRPDRGAVDLRLVPAALTAWAVTAAGIVWNLGPVLAGLSAAAGAGWWLAGRCANPGRKLLRGAAAGVLGVTAVGAGFGLAVGLRSTAAAGHPLAGRFGDTVAVTVLPTETPRAVRGGRVMVHADLLAAGGVPAAGRVLVFGSSSALTGVDAGRPAGFRARVSRPLRRDLTVAVLTATGQPTFGKSSATQRAAATVRAGLADGARRALPAAQAALLPGLVLGDTSTINAATLEEFRIAGLTHLTAVSGANVTIVCGAVLLAAGLIGPRTSAVLAGVVLVGFVVVVQPSPSVLRAAVMGGIALLAVLTARRRQAIPALCGAVIVLMLLAPQLAVDAGFALSVSATAALAVWAPELSAALVRRGWPKPLADAVSLAVAAQLVTAPLIAAISGQFSLVSILANVAVAPVIPPITVLGTAAAAVGPLWPAAAELLIRFTGPELWWLHQVAQTAAALPGAAVPVPAGWAGLLSVGAATLAGVVLWRRRRFGYAVGLAALCALAWSLSGLIGSPAASAAVGGS